MSENYFLYKTHCELIIVSEEVSPSSITEELGVAPTRFFKKGDQTISKASGSLVTKPHTLWAFELNATYLREETIRHHISHLKSIFLKKIDVLRKYKENPNFEVSLWLWIETDNAGIGLDLSSEDLDFINCISNKVHMSFISNKEMEVKLERRS